jgi:CheY-like chemotaxis protein
MTENANAGAVLVVEDDLAVQTALDELFAREGYRVVVAMNGVEAIEILEAGLKPCCVLVDLLMPGIIGTELLDYMQEADRTGIPVAIITGSPQLAPPGYPMFSKPLDTQALLDFVTQRCPVR